MKSTIEQFQTKPSGYRNGMALFTYAIATVLFSCNNSSQAPDNRINTVATKTTVTLTDAQYQNATIETAVLQQKEISMTLKLNGKIDVPPQNLVSVSVPLGGYLRSTKLLPGMHVKKGEIIAVMEDQQYIQLQQDYLLAKSNLQLAELDYNRQKELNQSQASSDKITQQAQAELNTQRILMNGIAEKLRLINKNPNTLSAGTISKSVNIYSSIDGYVSKVNVNIGKYVTPADVMFELINPTDIHLNLKVFEKDVAKLAIGQKVIAFDNAHPDKKYTCTIILISKNIASEGTADVHCHFETYDKNILPGMYMNAEVEIASTAENALPEESIVAFEGKEYVFVETKTHEYQMQEITTKSTENGFTQVVFPGKEDLSGKKFVTKGAYTLLMKLKNTERE